MTVSSSPSTCPRLSWSEQGSGPAVVLLHSSLASKAQWRGLAERLARRHHTLAIDLLGYGDAPAPGGYDDFTLATEVRRVLALVSQRLRPGERFQLVGHSYGGGVALRLAQTEPQRVASLALFDEAVREYSKALDLCPEFADLRVRLGNVYRDMGMFHAAVAEFEHAKKLRPDFVPARIHLGVTMFSLGRRDAAMAEWHEVLRIDPSNKRAQLYIRMCNDENGPQPGSALPR